MPTTFQVLHGNRVPPPAEPFTQHGVALGPSGGAIVSVHHREGRPRVIAARSFPPALAELSAAAESLLTADEYCLVGVTPACTAWTCGLISAAGAVTGCACSRQPVPSCAASRSPASCAARWRPGPS